MMDHRMAQELLWMVEDRELPEPQRHELLRHMEECRECAAQLAIWRAAQGFIKRMAQPEPSESFVASVMDRLPLSDAPMVQVRPARPRWAIPWWLVQHVGVGLAGFVLAIGMVAQHPPMLVSTETLLMAGSPEEARWEFSRQVPDPELLLNVTKEIR